MPTVPRYSESLVEPRPIPRVQATAVPSLEAFGGGESFERTNQAVQGLTSLGREIAIQEKRNADDTATQDAFAQSLNLKNNLFYDQQNGVTSKKGRQVTEFDFIGVYNKQIDDGLNEIDKKLSRDQQRQFAPMKQKIKGEFSGQVNNYFYDQTQVYRKEAAASNVMALREDAVNNWSQKNKFEENLALQDATIKSAHPELSEDGLNQLVLHERSKTWSGLIEMLADSGNDRLANEFYNRAINPVPDKYPGLITPGNMDFEKRPIVKMPDGRVASVRSISIETDQGVVLIPTVSPDGKIMSNQEAVKHYKDTGEHLGIFSSEKAADEYASKFHHLMGPHNQQLTVDDKDRLSKTLEVSSRLGSSQRYADEARRKYPNDFKSQLDYVQNISDARVRDGATSQLHRINGLYEQAENSRLERLYQSDVNVVRDAKNRGATSLSGVVAASHISQYTPSQVETLEKLLRPGVVETPRDVYQDLMRGYSNPETRMETAKMDKTNLPLSDVDFKHFEKMDQQIANGDQSSDNLLNSTNQKFQAIADVAANTLKLDTVKKKGGYSPEFREFQNAVLDKIAADEALGKKMKVKDYYETSSNLAKEFVTKKSAIFGVRTPFFDTKAPLYQLKPDDIVSVPQDFATNITAAAARARPPIQMNEERIKAAYITFLKNQAANQ